MFIEAKIRIKSDKQKNAVKLLIDKLIEKKGND